MMSLPLEWNEGENLTKTIRTRALNIEEDELFSIMHSETCHRTS